jgi:hypothetical protein
MKHLLLYGLIALIALMGSASAAFAGPWTKQSGEFYVKLGESVYSADAFRNADGETIEGTEYLSATTFVYAEYGVLDGLHIQTYVPLLYARNRVFDESFTDFGLGDASIAVQVSPLKLPLPTSLRLDAKVPLYGEPPFGPDAAYIPARGDGQVDLTAWLSAGAGTASYYFFADVGYQHRTSWTLSHELPGSFSDGFVYHAQVGYWLFGRAVLAINSGGVLPFEQDEISKGYVTVGPSLFFPLTDLIALEADGYFTPYSRNSAAGWSLGLGLSFRGRAGQ